MKRSRILMLLGYFPLVHGGAEYQGYLLACRLKQYYEVSFLFRYGSQKRTVKREGFTLHQIPRRVWTQRLLGWDYFLDSSGIRAVLDEVSPDIIYNRGANAYTGIAARYAKARGCRMVWHVAHERDTKPFHFELKRSVLGEYIDKVTLEYGVRNADCIIGQAKYQDRLLKENYGRNCDLIVPNFHPMPKHNIVKVKPFKIVWIANFKVWKRPEIFLRLAEEFGDRQGLKFVMIGRPASGRYQKRLEKAMSGLPHVVYRGARPISEVNRTLAEAHVLVNTSLYEGFPNTFVQAWFHHVPVVSLGVDPDGLLETNSLGFVSGSFEGMVRDVKRLIYDQGLRESMGRKAHEYARQHHSIETNVATILSLFASTH